MSYDSSMTDKECKCLLWSAPEILNGCTPSKAADVFSFGIILYEVIYEMKPYESNIPALRYSIRIILLHDIELWISLRLNP